MVGPLVRRGRKLVYHRGKGKWVAYSPVLDAKRKAHTRMRHWPPKKRSRYRHTAD